MMRKSLLFMTCALGISTSAQAVTVDQLMKWGGYAVEICQEGETNLYYKSFVSSSGETRFEKISDTQIALTGMWDAEVRFIFTLGNNGVESKDGTQLFISSTSTSTTSPRYTLYKASRNNGNSAPYYTYYSTPSKKWMGTIMEKSDGGYRIVFEPAYITPSLDLASTSGNSSTTLHSYIIDIYKPNATCSHDMYDVDQGYLKRNEEYPAKIDWNEDGSLSFLNLNHCGYAVNMDDYSLIQGKWFDDGQLVLYANQYAIVGGEYVSWNFKAWAQYRYMQFQDATDYFNFDYGYATVNGIDGISGVWEEIDLGHTNTRTTNWVTNDGDCQTISGKEIYISDFGGVCTNPRYFSQHLYTPVSLENNIIMADDKTLDVTLNLIEYDADEKDVYARGEVVSNKNFEHVSKYEVYMVPGNHSSINHHVGFRQNHEDGHTNAMLIYSKDMTDYNHVNKEPQATFAAERASENPADLGFEVRIPRTAIENAHGAFNQYNTLYVKAYYDNGLEPTFHDMRYKATVTGITELVSAADVDIKALPGAIFVDETEQTVNIFTPSGMMVYTGQAGTIPVAAGIYIVKVGNQTAKLVVK